MFRASAWAAAFVALATVGACKNGDVKGPASASGAAGAGSGPAGAGTGAAAGPTVVLHPPAGEVAIRVEIARTDAERQRGLMYREKLDADAGMIFLFDPPEQEHHFWMKNTYIPLDMVFITAGRRIAGIVENAEPLTETGRFVPAPSQFVLELKGGQAARLRLAAGQAVDFHGFSP